MIYVFKSVYSLHFVNNIGMNFIFVDFIDV